MLSVILYGRNDAHGYNLHKRGALSLNAIAEVLTGETDEIIFVDYNSPDELPTFPEAISDTLTQRCRDRLRIIRVRPSFHDRFTRRTRLVALESQSRNIAVRRANPANRWVLSTNTDMVFCPRGGHASLTEAIASLDDGFYHLPRFEVPEGFWERLDRKDPAAAIAAMQANGVRFHINEIILGNHDNLYEAPGDFQLFLRDDLWAINGFDERMILGWHVDSNIARRMRMLRGEVRTAVDHLWGYHCGHTRQATSLHAVNRTENDFQTFVTDLVRPELPEQADTWGFPDEAFEEVRLVDQDRYFPALSAAVGLGDEALPVETYNETSFCEIRYDPDHVAPHVADLLFNFPPERTILYFGADFRLFSQIAGFLRAAGRRPKFLVADLPDLTGDSDWDSLAERCDISDGVARAEIIILQYPSADLGPPEARARQEWLAQRFFFELQPRPGAPQRVVVINGIHNGLTQPLDYILSPATMPFSTRVRQGLLKEPIDAVATPGVEQPVYERLARRLPFTQWDRAFIDAAVAGLARGEPVEGWERLAPEIAAIASAPAPTRDRFDLPEDKAAVLAAAAAEAMRGAIAKLAEPPVPVGPRPELGNRLCSGSDWDSPEWLRSAVAFFNLDALDYRGRTRWMWEHVSLAVAIRHWLPVSPLSEAERRPAVLFAADWPDALAAVLAHLGYEVRYLTVPDILESRPASDWSHVLDKPTLTFPERWKPFDPEEGLTFDAFVSPLPGLFERDAADLDRVLAFAHARVRPGALLMITAPVQINAIAYEGALGLAEWQGLYTPEGPLGARGFTPVGGVDTRIPLDTAIRFAFEDKPQQSIRGLSYGYFASRMTSALITAAWPEALRPGPAERLAWSDDGAAAWQVEIPYLAGDNAVLRITREVQAGARDGLMMRGEEALYRPLAQVTASPRNVVAFAVTDAAARRSPTAIAFQDEAAGDDLGPWLSLGLDAGEAQRLIVEIEGDAEIDRAASVIHGLGEGQALVDGRRVEAPARDGQLGQVGLAIRLKGAGAVTGVMAYVAD